MNTCVEEQLSGDTDMLVQSNSYVILHQHLYQSYVDIFRKSDGFFSWQHDFMVLCEKVLSLLNSDTDGDDAEAAGDDDDDDAGNVWWRWWWWFLSYTLSKGWHCMWERKRAVYIIMSYCGINFRWFPFMIYMILA